jgi:hypothetical protein
VLTAQGLTLKGVEKIHRINCDASQKDVVLRTWQFGRMIRRDFYLLSYKLFFAMRRADLRTRVRRALDDLVEEADVLDVMTRNSELPTPDDSTFLNLRVLSGEAERTPDALLVADRALAKLNASYMEEVADENCHRMYAAYARLKNILIEPLPAESPGSQLH